MKDNAEQYEERYVEERHQFYVNIQFYVDIPEYDPPWWIKG